jgi:Cell division septal protein
MWHDPRAMNALSLTLVIVSVTALLWAAGKWLIHQPIFLFHSVDVRDVHRADPAHISAVIRRELRGTFFTMDLDNAQRALQQVPWVRTAGLHRQWPDMLIITIEEFEPFAFWNETALVSKQGEVFIAPYDGELPRLSGNDTEAKTVVDYFERWHRLLASINIGLSAVHRSPRNSWHIEVFGEYGAQWIELGKEDMNERLARFVSVYRKTIGAMAQSGLHTDYIDLRYRNGLAVRVDKARSVSRSM